MSEQAAPEVKLGGRSRTFKYTHAEREWLEDRFNKGLLELIKEDVMPTDPATGKLTGGGRWRAQVSVIQAGLRHEGKQITEAKVRKWIETHLAHDGHIVELINAAVTAIFASGVLGFTVKPSDEDEEGDEGKG